jgi:hypothetical protein
MKLPNKCTVQYNNVMEIYAKYHSVILQRQGGSESSKDLWYLFFPLVGGDRFMWRHYQTLVPYFSALCLKSKRININTVFTLTESYPS